jgi:hypothetical protein
MDETKLTKKEALDLMVNLTEEIKADIGKLMEKYLKEFDKLADGAKE